MSGFPIPNDKDCTQDEFWKFQTQITKNKFVKEIEDDISKSNGKFCISQFGILMEKCERLVVYKYLEEKGWNVSCSNQVPICFLRKMR